MSTANIISIVPVGRDAVIVTFSTNHGTATASYLYAGLAAKAIMEGDDPADYSGTRVS